MRNPSGSSVLYAMASLCIALSSPARAEGGNCPVGYYPVGGGPSVGCAPLPGSAGNGETQRTAVFEKRWGAIALDPLTGVYAIANQMNSRRRARKSALARCGAGCKLQFTYFNECVAIAQGLGPLAISTAADSSEAEMRALEQCAVVSSGCKVHASECSVPARVL